MIIVGIVESKEQAFEYNKILEIAVLGFHIQHVSRTNSDWKYSVGGK